MKCFQVFFSWIILIGAFSHLSMADWSCPQIDDSIGISCHCDLPHTLRCAGLPANYTLISRVMDSLRGLPDDKLVSLLEISVLNLMTLPANLFKDVSLHGVVISSGELKSISPECFEGLASNLSALGLPNNRLEEIPSFGSDLSDLERLDLSNNVIKIVKNNSLETMNHLEVLDLSLNKIAKIEDYAFKNLSSLKTLSLRDNLLSSILETPVLDDLTTLLELDLRGNAITGNLGATFLPHSIEALDLSANNFTALKRGMLNELKSLTSLQLSYNQIDIIEDQAFINLKSLTLLDLSHNRIVSISTGTWDGLMELVSLDLSHNFLRMITVDLMSRLSGLRSLILSDNDIVGVQAGSFGTVKALENLVLNDNPFSCDCQLKDFVDWLQGDKIHVDRGSAVCATPQGLENAQISELDADILTCNSDEVSSGEYDSYEVSLSGILHFRNLSQEGAKVEIEWAVDTGKDAFTCDLLFVYKIESSHETLLEQIPVSCNSVKSELSPTLKLVFIAGAVLTPNATYRLCLVLFEHHSGDDSALLPSCTDSFVYAGPKVETDGRLAFVIDDDEEYESFSTQPQLQLTAFHANVTMIDTLSVFMRISNSDCVIHIGVFKDEEVVLHKVLNCSLQTVTFPNVPTGYFDYDVCATFEGVDEQSPKATFRQCISAKSPWVWSAENVTILVAVGFSFMFVSILILVLAYIFSRRFFFPTKPVFSVDRKTPSRSFLFPVTESENTYSDDPRQPQPFEISTNLVQI